MSRFRPDFHAEKNDFYHFRPNTAVKETVVPVEQGSTLTEFKEALRKFSLNLTKEDLKKYHLASLTAKTCQNNKDLTHHWELIKTFFIAAIKEQESGESVIKNIEQQLQNVDLSTFCKKPVDNTSFLVYLLGILNGIL
jgi:hypothetical protein